MNMLYAQPRHCKRIAASLVNRRVHARTIEKNRCSCAGIDRDDLGRITQYAADTKTQNHGIGVDLIYYEALRESESKEVVLYIGVGACHSYFGVSVEW